jgi:hypothetical protein
MGVDYERWLIPKGNVFMPAAASVAKLVARLREDGWIADPKKPAFAALRFVGKREAHATATGGYAVRTIENRYGKDRVAAMVAGTEAQPAAIDAAWLNDPSREELRLVWPAAGDGARDLRYPLSRSVDGDRSWLLEIHRAPDYVYPFAENFDALDTTCPCGEDLEFDRGDDAIVSAFGAASGIFAECEMCSRTFDPAKRTATIGNPFDDTREEVPGGVAYRFALKVDCGKCFVHDDPTLAFAPELVALVEKEFGRAFYEAGACF